MPPSQETFNEIMKFLFTIQILNKLYHFNTTKFARHKASDEFDELLQRHIDRFVEAFIGRYNMKPVINSIKLDNDFITDDGIVTMYIQVRNYLVNLSNLSLDSDLLAIRDELLADVNKTLYLFNLK